MEKNKNVFIVLVISIIMLLCGCTTKREEVSVTRLMLNNGAYRSIEGGSYSIYSFNNDDIYEKLDTEYAIVSYNNESGNYVLLKDGDIFVNYFGKDIKISDENIQSPKLSYDGNYLFYFSNNGILEPRVFDLKNEKEITIENKTMISGHFVDWITDSKIVYYGVRNDDKKSGIFTYDLINKNEELIYEINKGYVSFLKSIDDEVVFIEDNMENKKILISLGENNTFTELTEKIIDLKDIIKINEDIYILGKVKDSVYSIYEVVDNDLHRVVYDFPIMINLEKGLSISSKGELLFMGSNNDYKEQNIYSYSNGTVKLVSQKEGNYTFININ